MYTNNEEKHLMVMIKDFLKRIWSAFNQLIKRFFREKDEYDGINYVNSEVDSEYNGLNWSNNEDDSKYCGLNNDSEDEVDDEKHIHLAYTNCFGLCRQLAYVSPEDKEKKHSNFSTLCIKVMRRTFRHSLV